MDNNINTQNGEKTFTQEQVNAIVGERLAKEKAKTEAAYAEREQQLIQKELSWAAKEKCRELGLPEELLEVLNISTPEAMEKALTTVKGLWNKREVSVVGAKPAVGNTEPRSTDAILMDNLRGAMKLPC